MIITERYEIFSLIIFLKVSFLCVLFIDCYQRISDAGSGWRFHLMLAIFPERSLITRFAIFAISALWVIIMTVVP